MRTASEHTRTSGSRGEPSGRPLIADSSDARSAASAFRSFCETETPRGGTRRGVRFWVTPAVIVMNKAIARVRTVRNTNTAYRDNRCELSSEYDPERFGQPRSPRLHGVAAL